MRGDELIAIILKEGASGAAQVSREQIVFDKMFRDICARNTCGNYGKCYMCPPDVGDIQVLIDKALQYEKAVLYQTISYIEDSFDFEGMTEAGNRHNACSRRIAGVIPNLPILHLSSGSCRACDRCAKRDGLACRKPEEAMASLEAYGVNVYQTACNAGLKYVNGQNTVTYFGMILYKENGDA